MKTERVLFYSVVTIKLMLLGTVLFLFGESRLMWADTAHYASLGRSLMAGHGLSFSADSPDVFALTTEFMPLYPALLGFFSLYVPHGMAALSLLQAIAASFTALYIFRIGKMFLPDTAALAAAFVASFEPLIAAIHLLLMPETFFVFFVTMFLYYILLYLQRSAEADIYKAAVALGCALYTKPAAVYLVFIAAVFIFVSSHGLRRAVVFLSIMFLIALPWMARNNAVAGTYAFNTNGARNMCSWGISSVLAVKYHVDSSNWNTTVYLPEYAAAKERCTSVMGAFRLFVTEYPLHFPAMLALSAASVLTNEGYTVFFEKPTEEQVKIHNNYLTPAVFANRDWPQKTGAALRELGTLEIFAIIAGKLFWLLVSVFAGMGMYTSFRKRGMRLSVLFLTIVAVYFVGASMVAAGLSAGARYRYQIDALLIIFAFTGALSYAEGSSVLLRRLPITKIKISIARLLYRIVRLRYRNNKQIVKRDGIVYELDLSEGIDLSVFLFGSFQKHVFQNRYFSFAGDEVVFDVGANAGVMSLQFAKRVPNGMVYAFEPTQYALEKLKKNISLNPAWALRIAVVHSFVSSQAKTDPHITAYASWKVDGSPRGPHDHQIHLGTPKDTTGAPSTTIDAYVKQHNMVRLDFIKIDTDGHEWDVLQGASEVIAKFHPVIIFEVGEYVMQDRGISFKHYYEFFRKNGYRLYDSNRDGEIVLENHEQFIPRWGAIDVIAVAGSRPC